MRVFNLLRITRYLFHLGSLFAVALFLTCVLSEKSVGQSDWPTATVHLKVVDCNGEDLGPAKVVRFENEESKDFAKKFVDNAAKEIPFGVYRLSAIKHLFAYADYTVNVDQKDVWVVVQLDVSIEGSPLYYKIAGTLSGAPEGNPIWVRAQGVYSSVIADAQAGKDGKFDLAGLPAGTYILTTRQDTRILDIRSVVIPAKGREHAPGVIIPVLIKLSPTLGRE
jgi:hypothetical protein